MYCLYILENLAKNRYYIGSTNNLQRRLNEHKKGKVRTTRVLKTLELVYNEEFKTEKESRQREKQLKLYKSKKYLEWLVKQKNRAGQ